MSDALVQIAVNMFQVALYPLPILAILWAAKKSLE